jgi:flagellin FlaB
MWKKALIKLVKQKRGMVGLEAAIILIAFVIIAAVFSFMVINQGLFATERGKTVIQEGLNQASTPLAVDGTIFVKTNQGGTVVEGIVIPLKPYGVKYVAMWKNTTVVTLKVGSGAWANIYDGVNSSFAEGSSFTELLDDVTNGTAKLFIQNTDGDEALSSYEKGYLVINLNTNLNATGMTAGPRDPVRVEIRLEKSAPLTIEFYVPEVMPADTWLTV